VTGRRLPKHDVREVLRSDCRIHRRVQRARLVVPVDAGDGSDCRRHSRASGCGLAQPLAAIVGSRSATGSLPGVRLPACGEMYAAASPSERRIAYRRRWMALFAAHCVLFTIVFAGGALLDSVLYGHENLERFPGAHAPPGADFTVIALKGEVLSKTPSSGSPNRIVVTPGTVLAQDAVSIRASADRDPSLALRLDGVSLDPLQEIQLPAEPGHYWLIARVADTVSGHVVSRVREIEVAARSE